MKIKGDWYMKFILTVISILLLGILLKPSIAPEKVKAGPGQYVYVENSLKNPIPVKIVSGGVDINHSIKVYGSVDVNGSVEVYNSRRTPLYVTE